MSDDAFTRNRFEWLEAIAADRALSSHAVRVAIVISKRLSRSKGYAWPSITTIADEAGSPVRTVERAVSELCNAGYLVRRRGGFSKSNHYEIPENSPHRCSGEQVYIPATGGGNESPIPATGGGSFPPRVADHSRHGWRTNPLREPSDRTLRGDISPPTPSLPRSQKAGGGATALEAEFEDFWRQYPRRVARGQALKAFKAARANTEFDTIMAGALRYAHERTGQEARFTKHPATWLTGQCWADEAAPPPLTAVASPSSSHTGKNRMFEALQRVRAKDGTHG